MSGTVQSTARGQFAGFHRTTYYAVYLYNGSNDGGVKRKSTHYSIKKPSNSCGDQAKGDKNV
jgi:hypothetical protein